MTGRCYFCASREHHECHSTACTCCGERNLKHQQDVDRLETAIRLHASSTQNKRVRAPKSRRKRGTAMATGTKKPKVTLDQVLAAVEEDDFRGFCLACGAEAYGCEPDARRYLCESCGEHRVYGAEEILLHMVA